MREIQDMAEEIDEIREPWETITDLLESEDQAGLSLLVDEMSSVEIARTMSRLAESRRSALLQILGPEQAGAIIGAVPESQAKDLIREMSSEEAASILHQIPDEMAADLLQEIEKPEAEAIYEKLPLEEAERTRELASYDSKSAGGLMSNTFLSFRGSKTVGEVIENLRENSEIYQDYTVQYAYVVDADDHLRGVLRLRDLLLAKRATLVREMMIPHPTYLTADSDLEKMSGFFDNHSFLGVPVVKSVEDPVLVGVLDEISVRSATEKQARSTFLKLSGIIGGEELRSVPLHIRSLRRLSFLAPNILLNLAAASVIAIFQDTLQAAIVLAVFLPIISDMSGCSGGQAVAVSIRELTLGLLRPTEFLHVIFKEGAIGIINGLVLGCVLGGIAAVWQGNPWLALVVGASLAANTLVSVILGGLIPLFLRRLKLDPALASGPILTTVTDMCGFFLVLSIASSLLEKL